MLVLNRKVGERIVIGENIVMTVVAVHGQQVRLGIEAPASVAVWREELLRLDQPESAPPPRRDLHLVEVQC